MITDIWTLAGDYLAGLLTNPAYRLAWVSATFIVGTVLVDKLASVQIAIRKGAESQKEVALEAGIDQGHFARKLKGDAHMTLRDIDAMPVPVQQWFHLEEVMRLGLPEEIKKALHIGRMMRGMKRSA